MSINSVVRNRIREVARELNLSSARAHLASQVKELTNKTLSTWHALSPVPGGAGLESFNGIVPTVNLAFNVANDGDPKQLMEGLKKLGMPERHIEVTTEQCLNLFDSGYNTLSILKNAEGAGDSSYVPMATVVGRTMANEFSTMNEYEGLEAFGDDINRLGTDNRLSMSLMIMRPYENIMDKALARVSDSSPIVTIRIPRPEAYDWAITQNAGSTVATRYNSNTYPLRDLYRNPSPVNSAPKKIIPIVANDSGSVLYGSGNYYKTGVNVSLLDLSRNTAAFTYATIDRTDLIADGGQIIGVLVRIVATVATVVTTEVFFVPLRQFDSARFVNQPNNRGSAERQVMMQATFPIGVGTPLFSGAASTIAGALTDARIQLDVRINANLNLQTGVMQASGTASMTLLRLASGAAISATTNTMFGTAAATLVAYDVDLQFNEENQRKANLAIWTQYREEQFAIPRSRVYFTEFSLSQDVDTDAIATTASIVALGNGRRGLDIIVNALNDTAEGLTFANTYPEIVSLNRIDEQSFAASLVKPTVVTTTLDYDNEDVNTMNESTRLSEIHGRFRARFLSMVATLFANSLMLNQYKNGETPVIKAWVHSTIADIVIGILDYHPVLNDKEAVSTGADYSMLLPNGYRLDIIKSNFDCLKNRLYAIPVIESDPASILSGASIRDCGTVTTNYQPSNAGSVVRRVATTTREIVMMSNKVGILMNIIGLTAQLGAQAATPILLSADSSNSTAI